MVATLMSTVLKAVLYMEPEIVKDLVVFIVRFVNLGLIILKQLQ